MDDTPLVEDLCSSALIAYGNEHILRLQLIDGTSKKKGFLDLSDASMDYPDASPTLSLFDLAQSGTLKNKYRFYPAEKKVLAYTLAHALLNLSDTYWLRQLWSLDNIFFLYSPATGEIRNVHQPYVGCTLSADADPQQKISHPYADPAHSYPNILFFGKLLWELEMGEQLAKLHKTNKRGDPSLWMTMKDCYDTGKYQLGRGYANALEACINFPVYLVKHKKANREQDDATAVQTVILKSIVQELESEVDLRDREQWGRRTLKLPLAAEDTKSTGLPSIPREKEPLSQAGQSSKTTAPVPRLRDTKPGPVIAPTRTPRPVSRLDQSASRPLRSSVVPCVVAYEHRAKAGHKPGSTRAHQRQRTKSPYPTTGGDGNCRTVPGRLPTQADRAAARAARTKSLSNREPGRASSATRELGNPG